MQLSQENYPNQNHVQAYEGGKIKINGEIITDNVLILPDKIIHPWKIKTLEELTDDDVRQILTAKPEIIIFGTGEKTHFPHPEFYVKFQKHNIGLEIMSTLSACKTYNILLADNRRLVAGFII